MAEVVDVPFVTGHQMIFTTDKVFAEMGIDQVLHIDHKNLPEVMVPGKVIYIDDSVTSFKVLEVPEKEVNIQALNSGKLSSKKGVNLTKTNVDLLALSENYKADPKLGVEQDLCMVFASFIPERRGLEGDSPRLARGQKACQDDLQD